MLHAEHCASCETRPLETDEALRARLADDGIRVLVQVEGKRKMIRHGGKLCSGCNAKPRAPGQRYCKTCHAEASKKYRARVKEKYAALCARLAAYEGLVT